MSRRQIKKGNININNSKLKYVSTGLSCLLAISEGLSLNNSVKANGIIQTIKIIRDEIKNEIK